MAEREVRWQSAGRVRLDFLVRRLDDIARVRDLLRPRIEYTAYALGQLEPGLIERARWFQSVGNTGTALVLHSQGGLGEATFVMGDPDAVSAILSIHPGPSHTYATCQPQHLTGFKSLFRLSTQQTMIRMSVTPSRFAPSDGVPVVQLSGLDIQRINSLYSTEGGPSYYNPEHIDNGVYRGVMAEKRLVAVAGTHVVSRQEGVAVVGNVFTHPDHRGRGYARAVTSAVTQHLLQFCEHVVLTVDPTNRPAVAAYDRLGYREVCQLVEASAARKDFTGGAAAVRRARAAIRGRGYDGSFVTIRAR